MEVTTEEQIMEAKLSTASPSSELVALGRSKPTPDASRESGSQSAGVRRFSHFDGTSFSLRQPVRPGRPIAFRLCCPADRLIVSKNNSVSLSFLLSLFFASFKVADVPLRPVGLPCVLLLSYLSFRIDRGTLTGGWAERSSWCLERMCVWTCRSRFSSLIIADHLDDLDRTLAVMSNKRDTITRPDHRQT